MIKSLLESTKSVREILSGSLDPLTKEALRRWTGLDKDMMSHVDETGRGADRTVAHVNALNHLLQNSAKHSGTIYRYLNNVPNWKVGQVITLDSMTSFTELLPSQVMRGKLQGLEGFTAVLVLKNSKSGVSIASVSNYPEEEEVLVPKKTKIRITDRFESHPDDEEVS